MNQDGLNLLIFTLSTCTISFSVGRYFFRPKKYVTRVPLHDIFAKDISSSTNLEDSLISIFAQWPGNIVVVANQPDYLGVDRLSKLVNQNLIYHDVAEVIPPNWELGFTANTVPSIIYFAVAEFMLPEKIMAIQAGLSNMISQTLKNIDLEQPKLLILVEDLMYLGNLLVLDSNCGLIQNSYKKFYLIATPEENLRYTKQKANLIVIGDKHFFYLIETMI